MGIATSVEGIPAGASAPTTKALCTALEILLVYAAILLYIWRWQFHYPHAWSAIWAVVLLSHFVHRDSPRLLGLTLAELRPNAQIVLTLAAAVYVPLALYGFARHKLVLMFLDQRSLIPFVGYGLWCVVQQYLAQSYFHNRLLTVVQNRHLSSLLVGVMFGAAHIPNPILMAATTLGGVILSEIFALHRCIWPLAFAQAVGGFLIAAISPASLIHHMRVGPGYFFYGLR
jgi:hypothetical protein